MYCIAVNVNDVVASNPCRKEHGHKLVATDCLSGSMIIMFIHRKEMLCPMIWGIDKYQTPILHFGVLIVQPELRYLAKSGASSVGGVF